MAELHLIRELGKHTAKLRRHDGFRVATEIYETATMTGAPDHLLELMWDAVLREFAAAEKMMDGTEARQV